jgi:hypothetical protein
VGKKPSKNEAANCRDRIKEKLEGKKKTSERINNKH